MKWDINSVTLSGVGLLLPMSVYILRGLPEGIIPLILTLGFIYVGCCITSSRPTVNLNINGDNTVVKGEE